MSSRELFPRIVLISVREPLSISTCMQVSGNVFRKSQFAFARLEPSRRILVQMQYFLQPIFSVESNDESVYVVVHECEPISSSWRITSSTITLHYSALEGHVEVVIPDGQACVSVISWDS